MKIFVHSGGEQKGPLTEPEIQCLLSEGLLSPDDLAYHEGLDNWVQLSTLFKTDTPISRETPKPSGARTKVFAAACAMALIGVGLFLWSLFFQKTDSDPKTLDIVIEGRFEAPFKGRVESVTDGEGIKKYDSKGNMIEEVTYNASGEVTSKSTFKYDSKGNEVERIGYNASEKQKEKKSASTTLRGMRWNGLVTMPAEK